MIFGILNLSNGQGHAKNNNIKIVLLYQFNNLFTRVILQADEE